MQSHAGVGQYLPLIGQVIIASVHIISLELRPVTPGARTPIAFCQMPHHQKASRCSVADRHSQPQTTLCRISDMFTGIVEAIGSTSLHSIPPTFYNNLPE